MLLTTLACTSRITNADSAHSMAANDTAIVQQPGTSDLDPEEVVHEDDESGAFLDCFIVIADTGRNYFALRDQMLQLHNNGKAPIDTLGRTYDISEGAIVYIDSADMEADNSYFPRRYPDTTLSLEYLHAYAKHAGRKTIALVTGIYEDKKDADAALAKLKASTVKAFLIPATVYLGCMN